MESRRTKGRGGLVLGADPNPLTGDPEARHLISP